MIAGTLYLIVTLLASAVVETGVLANTDAPLVTVGEQGPLGVDPKVFAAITLFALSNGALINMIMASRIVYGMSEEGIVPGFFGRVRAVGAHRSPRSSSPRSSGSSSSPPATSATSPTRP